MTTTLEPPVAQQEWQMWRKGDKYLVRCYRRFEELDAAGKMQLVPFCIQDIPTEHPTPEDAVIFCAFSQHVQLSMSIMKWTPEQHTENAAKLRAAIFSDTEVGAKYRKIFRLKINGEFDETASQS